MIALVLAKQNCKSLLFGKMSNMFNFWSNRSQKVQIFIPKSFLQESILGIQHQIVRKKVRPEKYVNLNVLAVHFLNKFLTFIRANLKSA
jgi:hypothetical protein